MLKYLRKAKPEETEALTNPLPGDHWHEMFSYHVIVAKVTTKMVWTVEGSGDFAKTCEVHQMTREQFRKRMCYESEEMRHLPMYCLQSRDFAVEGILDRVQERKRPWIEHSPVL